MSFHKAQNLRLEENKGYIINVGSVGQSRDGDWRASLPYTTAVPGQLKIKRIGYDIETAQKENPGFRPS